MTAMRWQAEMGNSDRCPHSICRLLLPMHGKLSPRMVVPAIEVGDTSLDVLTICWLEGPTSRRLRPMQSCPGAALPASRHQMLPHVFRICCLQDFDLIWRKAIWHVERLFILQAATWCEQPKQKSDCASVMQATPS